MSLSSIHPSVLSNPSIDWHRLSLPPIHFLKNRLKNSTSVTVPLDVALAPFHQAQMLTNDLAPDDWVGTWISSVFDVAARQRTSSGTEWDGWDKDKSYCQPCLTKFLDEHVWRWLLEERIKGASFRPTCPLVVFDNRLTFLIL